MFKNHFWPLRHLAWWLLLYTEAGLYVRRGVKLLHHHFGDRWHLKAAPAKIDMSRRDSSILFLLFNEEQSNTSGVHGGALAILGLSPSGTLSGQDLYIAECLAGVSHGFNIDPRRSWPPTFLLTWCWRTAVWFKMHQVEISLPQD